MEAQCISYTATGYFSQTISDYLDNAPELQPFYGYSPTWNGFEQQLANKTVIADRQVLVQVLKNQYQTLGTTATQSFAAIEKLANSNTYTVTTGHQLNIFAGPLYFIYKIVTAIKLAAQLKERFPDKEFVPVYWMASEDHDFAEINYTNIGGKKVHWWHEATGATGRINPDTMRQALNQYKGVLGLGGYAESLGEIVEHSYAGFDKLADATRYLVNALFGQYGLVIIDADDKAFKQQFAPIIQEDIVGQHSYKNITATNELLRQQGVHIQVNPREINFFYLMDGLRERIVLNNGIYEVLNTDISFTEEALIAEINNTPERFSPNVVMRPLYQECILPNIAYIGGGAEVVYWLELKSNFEHYGVDFPILILRNSGLIVPARVAGKAAAMGLTAEELFKTADEIKNSWIKKHSEHHLSLADEWAQIETVLEKMRQSASSVDATLSASAEAVKARMQKAVNNLEKKMIKAEKLNYEVRLEQVEQIKTALFPNNSLQERTENFGLFYVKWGQQFIDELLKHFEPLAFEFTVLTEQ